MLYAEKICDLLTSHFFLLKLKYEYIVDKRVCVRIKPLEGRSLEPLTDVSLLLLIGVAGKSLSIKTKQMLEFWEEMQQIIVL